MDKDGNGARRLRLIFSTAAAWGGVYLLQVLRENSLEAIEPIVVLLATALTLGLGFEVYEALFGTKRPSRVRKDATPTETFALAGDSRPAPSVDLEGTKVDLATKSLHRFNLFLGSCAAAGLFFYFVLARYVQVLSSSILWIAAGALAVAGTAYCFVFVEPRLRPAFKSKNDRNGTLMTIPLALLVASNMALRLVNATPGLVLSPTPQSAHVSSKTAGSAWKKETGSGYSKQKFPVLTVDLDFEDGGSTSVHVSDKTFDSVQLGDVVDFQRRVGLLGLPWCLGDCFVIPQR